MLGHIFSLADPLTWQHSQELSRAAVEAWIAVNGLSNGQGFSDATTRNARDSSPPPSSALGKMGKVRGDPPIIRRVYLVGHGSSLYNGMVGKAVIEGIAGIPTEAIPAYSFAQHLPDTLLGPETLVVGVSTTGRTQAVVDALAKARRAGAHTLALTAHAGTPVTQDVQAVLFSGGEADTLSVKTSSYVLALIPLYSLAASLAGEAADPLYWQAQIEMAADIAARFLRESHAQVQSLAQTFAKAERLFFLGSGPNLGTAEEGALKVVEMAKMHAAAHELENFFHGRLREVDQANPMFIIAPHGKNSPRVLDFLTVMHHVHSPTIVLTDVVTPGISELATHVIRIPSPPEGSPPLDELATPLVYILPLHLFGYEMALARGWDPNARRYNLVPQEVRYGDRLGTPLSKGGRGDS